MCKYKQTLLVSSMLFLHLSFFALGEYILIYSNGASLVLWYLSWMVLRSAQHPQIPNTSLYANFLRNLANALFPPELFRTLALFAQRTRIPTFPRSTGFFVIWVCISSSSSDSSNSAAYFWFSTCPFHFQFGDLAK